MAATSPATVAACSSSGLTATSRQLSPDFLFARETATASPWPSADRCGQKYGAGTLGRRLYGSSAHRDLRRPVIHASGRDTKRPHHDGSRLVDIDGGINHCPARMDRGTLMRGETNPSSTGCNTESTGRSLFGTLRGGEVDLSDATDRLHRHRRIGCGTLRSRQLRQCQLRSSTTRHARRRRRSARPSSRRTLAPATRSTP